MRPTKALSMPEFIGLVAFLIAAVAFAIDAMLPALPLIADELTPADPNQAQLVLSFFLFGMGVGTMFVGPLSDSFGRKRVMTIGLVIYAIGAFLSTTATTIEMLFAARILQGLGAAAPRVVATAMVRDLYEGRRMAQISSFVMMVFIIVPSMAPFIGAALVTDFGWRGIFGGFVVFAIIAMLWLNIRQPETLIPENRRSLKLSLLLIAAKEVVRNRLVVIYIVVQTLAFGQMFALLSTIQQIYEVAYDKSESFPTWFLIGGLTSGLTTVFNAALVMRLGMRTLVIFAFAAQVLISGSLLLLTRVHLIGDVLPFELFFVWQVSVFAMAGLVFGNLNALSLEPLGHIAGMATSVLTASSTILSILLAVPIGLAFNGTPNPLLLGTLAFSLLAWILMRYARALSDRNPSTPPQG